MPCVPCVLNLFVVVQHGPSHSELVTVQVSKLGKKSGEYCENPFSTFRSSTPGLLGHCRIAFGFACQVHETPSKMPFHTIQFFIIQIMAAVKNALAFSA